MPLKIEQRLFPLEPQYRERVWGGQRLKACDPPVGEAWIAFAESLVYGEGAHAGQTVAALAEKYGAEFLGEEVAARHGARFPLLVKLLDCADWLSVQVHPNDEQARRLVGPEASGKTEAWHFLEAEPGATIYAGVKPGTTSKELETAICTGRILEVAHEFEVRTGETYLLPAGTLHALGPGLLLYEVQQSSDTTYRVYDWGRPATPARRLHIEESIAVTDPRGAAMPSAPPVFAGTSAAAAVRCPYFELEILRVAETSLRDDTGGRAFHLLTATEGAATITCGGERVRLDTYETALVAGAARGYEIHAEKGAATLMRATVPHADAL